MQTTAAYGSWKSPITSDLLVAGITGLDAICLDGDDVYWLEMRPTENGRTVIMRQTATGEAVDVTPPDYNVRSRVHEYGGGGYTVHQGTVYFVNFADQRLYRQRPGAEPEAVTPEAGGYRYADGVVDERYGRFLCIREAHQPDHEPVNTLVSLALDGQSGQVLHSGYDFYASPCLSPDGRYLAWLAWNHPNMPWDGTELWLAEMTADGLENAQRVAGGIDESIFQPAWSPDGGLYFVSDRNNWWNLYCWQAGTVVAVYEMAAEFGLPQWVFDLSTYGFSGDGRIVTAYTQDARWYLATIGREDGRFTPLSVPFDTIHQVRVRGEFVYLAGAAADRPLVIARLHLVTGALDILRQSSRISIDAGHLSQPQTLAFPTENGLTAYALYYPPTNQAFMAPEGERPPLLVISHGGPTSAANTQLNWGIQYWTSRGFGVLDVNYGGSTGYGREYRQRLNQQWGVVDVQDCVHGARYLVAEGLVDGQRLAIRGGSAGGYTTLCALTFYDLFQAGASFFGVSDVEALAQDTHKFESRYLDSLIGPYPAQRELYVSRSPIHFVDRMNCPLLLLQGLEDRVVPPSQSETIYRALRQKGIPVAYVAFPGEQHGFRQAKNIKRSLDAELYFYGRIFHFHPADVLEPLVIDNLDPL